MPAPQGRPYIISCLTLELEKLSTEHHMPRGIEELGNDGAIIKLEYI